MPTKEFQESWAFLYFPVQSIGHAFFGAMENDEARYEDHMEEQEVAQQQQQEIGHQSTPRHSCNKHSDCQELGDTFFCSESRICSADTECHYDHDAIDKQCPRGALKSVKAVKPPGNSATKEDDL